MQATERKHYIMQVLKKDFSVNVITLSNNLNASKVTIRKDLDDLAKEGLVKRTHGGAVAVDNKNVIRFISNTIKENAEEKKAICKEAFKLVKKRESIIIDSGSTTVHLSPLVAKTPLTVITNSLLVMQELAAAEAVELLMVGGQLRRPSLSAIGYPAREYFKQIHADILFLGASGFSLEEGISCTDIAEAEIKQAMIQSASLVCLLADSTKSGTVSLANVCSWNKIDVFITDEKIDLLTVKELEDRDVKVIVAQ